MPPFGALSHPGITLTAYDLAQRFVGVREVSGNLDHPQIMAMLTLDTTWPTHDEVPWCSAFVNYICWLLRLPRSKNLMARSWLAVGRPVGLNDAVVGFDVVVLNRADGPQASNILDAPGHVGFFAGRESGRVVVLGGNQSNQVSLAQYPAEKVLGVRRLL
jgi:uncharacterized protein (TIGR02594 family)